MDINAIKKRFIERLNSSTKEELEERMLTAEPTGFGNLLHECGLYEELTKSRNEKTGYFTMSMNVRKTTVNSAYSGPQVYSNEAPSDLEEGLAAA